MTAAAIRASDPKLALLLDAQCAAGHACERADEYRLELASGTAYGQVTPFWGENGSAHASLELHGLSPRVLCALLRVLRGEP